MLDVPVSVPRQDQVHHPAAFRVPLLGLEVLGQVWEGVVSPSEPRRHLNAGRKTNRRSAPSRVSAFPLGLRP